MSLDFISVFFQKDKTKLTIFLYKLLGNRVCPKLSEKFAPVRPNAESVFGFDSSQPSCRSPCVTITTPGPPRVRSQSPEIAELSVTHSAVNIAGAPPSPAGAPLGGDGAIGSDGRWRTILGDHCRLSPVSFPSSCRRRRGDLWPCGVIIRQAPFGRWEAVHCAERTCSGRWY